MSTTPFTVLIDGLCPLCKHEGAMLMRLDRGRGRLRMVDIAAPEFDASAYGTTFERVMGTIHGVDERGGLITGVEVFRRAYRAVGLGWLLAWTAWPGLRPVVDRAYRWFARNRLRLTGRPACEAGRCVVAP